MHPSSVSALSLAVLIAVSATPRARAEDVIKKLQSAAIADASQKASRAYHFGSQGPGDVFSNHTQHTNRLIPVYAFGRGVTLGTVTGSNSPYRDREKVKALYGFLPAHTVNPDAEYADQSDFHRVLLDATDRGVRHVFIVWFDGMDWQTTRAAAIVKSGKVYDAGKGSGLIFQDYEAEGSAQFGYFITSPTHEWKAADVDATKPPVWLDGGYDARIAGPNPWTDGPLKAPGYLKGQDADASDKVGVAAVGGVLHAVTDSAPSAAEFINGVKSFNHGLNLAEDGRAVSTLFHLWQERGWRVGTVTSVPFDHASPAAMYAHSAHRDDFQDIAREMLGLPSNGHPDRYRAKEPAHPGLDVVIGVGLGHEAKPTDLAKQGKNAVPGNLYITDGDREDIDVRNGGKYVVVQRTPGVSGSKALRDAATDAAREGHRLFGFFGGSDKDHLPYRTADARFDPVRGIKYKAETYAPADLFENPSLAEMTSAALTVLAAGKHPFALFVEAGDIDFALHDNNLDNALGAIYSGEEAVRVIIDWVERHSNWDESALIVTADHGHYLVLDDPRALIIPGR